MTLQERVAHRVSRYAELIHFYNFSQVCWSNSFKFISAITEWYSIALTLKLITVSAKTIWAFNTLTTMPNITIPPRIHKTSTTYIRLANVERKEKRGRIDLDPLAWPLLPSSWCLWPLRLAATRHAPTKLQPRENPHSGCDPEELEKPPAFFFTRCRPDRAIGWLMLASCYMDFFFW